MRNRIEKYTQYICLILLVFLVLHFFHTYKQYPFKDIAIDDCEAVYLLFEPEPKLLSRSDAVHLMFLLYTISVGRKTNGYHDIAGGNFSMFRIKMKDGSFITIGGSNDIIVIDGVGYLADIYHVAALGDFYDKYLNTYFGVGVYAPGGPYSDSN